jgi:hypothetical protein
MSALASQRRVDTEALRPLMPVAAVLRHFGIEAAKEKGRIRCPVHAGENSQVLSYDATRWHCFNCEAGGDVFDLVMALRGCGFREALAVIAELAGLAVAGLPRIDRAEIARRETIARRRAALRRWRVERLRQFLNLVGDLGRDADQLGAYYAERERRDDPDRWRLLGALHWDLTRAEYMAALLSTTDEGKWAELWLAEQRGELLTPGDLA